MEATVVSCRTGEGLDELLAAVETTVAEIGVFGHGSGGSGGAEPPLLTRERHRRHRLRWHVRWAKVVAAAMRRVAGVGRR